MIMTDKKKTISIRMLEWYEPTDNYGPDLSNDFFEAARLPIVWIEKIKEDAYWVKDVSCCIEQAEDWKNYRRDFGELGPEDVNEQHADALWGIERVVDIEVLCEN